MSVISSPVAQPASRAVRVTRSRRPTWWAGVLAVVVIAALAYLPYVVYTGTTNFLVNVFILVIMASMWNLLAGYAGLVSVGQQAFIGLGSYFVLILAQHGINPFLALPVAAVGCGVVGLPVWWLVRRLRTAYFAIATWVVSSVFYYLIIRFQSLGGGTGMQLPGLLTMNTTLVLALTYWTALVVVVLAVGGAYLLLRSRVGLVLTAIRDDEVAARSSGGRTGRVQRLVFLVAAVGCGAAGALVIINQPFVQPNAAFSVSWSAEMIFATIIGGIGSIEGPIIGAVIFYALQQALASYGTLYFMILGAVAIVIAIWARRGLWGVVADKLNIRVFPVGYYLWPRASGASAARANQPPPAGQPTA